MYKLSLLDYPFYTRPLLESLYQTTTTKQTNKTKQNKKQYKKQTNKQTNNFCSMQVKKVKDFSFCLVLLETSFQSMQSKKGPGF